MSRIQASFKTRKALIPYLTAGDPDLSVTLEALHLLAREGADIIELGVPFSDPMADGPVIQKAHERALAQGVTLRNVLALVSTFRQQNSQTAIVLMSYLNPIEVMGYETFCKAAFEAGVDGLLVVDMPPEEAAELREQALRYELDLIFLLAPTTSQERMKTICSLASGYVYYVSLRGVTGADIPDVDEIAEKIKQIRSVTHLPIGVGFGVKDARTARLIGDLADGVVIGSALVRELEQCVLKGRSISEVAGFIQAIRKALL